ncbi:M14 family metallopeptidase [Fulvivirgaceae bacterium BMA10]|uniref:M14 family metallopeptidase n=1 Tax=Splendidivirga corallicola TaxID=3051826 RepID=A0ABT8KRQ3_9BACT|nr:M14 family metallopeptidase [Fulvivirgaceae bacterium BMA10]
MTNHRDTIEQQLFNDYNQYKEGYITHRKFRHLDLVKILDQYEANDLFHIRKLGESIEGRSINLVKLGQGSLKILLWSQMHGDEATATMALFDIFNFFHRSNDRFEAFKSEILKKATLYFIPMLNPDGAERFQRRNAMEVDLNRDARNLMSPESQILKNIRDEINADFGFNLHDQDTHYTVGNTEKAAAISFLAPPFNESNEINQVRERAMKVIGKLSKGIKEIIPGHVAKYSDEYESRAFGDNIQKWGTSTILIESGGYPGDPEKQFLRQINFVTLLSALNIISNGSYQEEPVKTYHDIPFNQKYLFDLLLRNVTLTNGSDQYKLDIGFNHDEVFIWESRETFFRAKIEDIGDLSGFYGYNELDTESMQVEIGKSFPKVFQNINQLTMVKVVQLLKEGFTSVLVEDCVDREMINLPIFIYKDQKGHDTVKLESNPGLIVRQGSEVRYAIVNGFVYDLQEGKNNVKNGLVI